MTDKEILAILEKKEKRRLLNQIQAQSEKEGHVPPTPFLLLKKMTPALQYTGGILFGIFLGVFILIFNFLFFVFLLHLHF